MKCCTNIISLGCFNVCEDIDTGLVASEDGTHIIEIKFNNIMIKKEVDLLIGDPFLLPKMYLNENAELIISIKQPSGYLEDCYSIYTKPCINV